MDFIQALEKALYQMVAALEINNASLITESRTELYSVIDRTENVALGQGDARAQKYAELAADLKDVCSAAVRDEALGGAGNLWKDTLETCKGYFLQYHLLVAAPLPQIFSPQSATSFDRQGTQIHAHQHSSGNLPAL